MWLIYKTPNSAEFWWLIKVCRNHCAGLSGEPGPRPVPLTHSYSACTRKGPVKIAQFIPSVPVRTSAITRRSILKGRVRVWGLLCKRHEPHRLVNFHFYEPPGIFLSLGWILKVCSQGHRFLKEGIWWTDEASPYNAGRMVASWVLSWRACSRLDFRKTANKQQNGPPFQPLRFLKVHPLS